MTRGRRALAQFVLLPVLYVLSLPNPIVFANGIALVLLFSPAVTVTVAGILVWTARQAPGIETLRERADDAVTLAEMSLGAFGLAVLTLAMNFGVAVPGRPVLSLLAWVCVLIVVPALGWLATWRRYWLPQVRDLPADGHLDRTPAQGGEALEQHTVQVEHTTTRAAAGVHQFDADPLHVDEPASPARTNRRPKRGSGRRA